MSIDEKENDADYNNADLDYRSCAPTHDPHPFHRYLPPPYAAVATEHTKAYAEMTLQQLWDALESIKLVDVLNLANSTSGDIDIEFKEMDIDVEEDGELDDQDKTWLCVWRKWNKFRKIFTVISNEEASYELTPLQRCRVLHRILHLLSACESSTRVLRVCSIERNGKSLRMFEDDEFLTNARVDFPLHLRFALPSVIRDSLLTMALSILSEKDYLRSYSRTAIICDEDLGQNYPTRFVIHWESLLVLLLRTVPYLDEKKCSPPPTCSSSKQSQLVKRTTKLVKACRRYFADNMEWDVWSMLESDLLEKSYSNACFRAQVIIYLFLPSQCSTEFYTHVLPLWFESWANVDRCIEFDMVWLILFSRARKYSSLSFDWSLLRKRLLTYIAFWLQVPAGSSDDARNVFPSRTPGVRSIPYRIKTLLGLSGTSDEGLKFVNKLAKLLVFCSCNSNSCDESDGEIVSEGISDLLRFLSFLSPYFNPSNTGKWSNGLAQLLRSICFNIAYKVGSSWGHKTLIQTHPKVADQLERYEPSNVRFSMKIKDLVRLLDVLLPLCQEAIYSKNVAMSNSGQVALVDLAHIIPEIVCPFYLEFACNAFHVSSIHQTHQVPTTFSTLVSLICPCLKLQPRLLLNKLPELLNLSLDGISCNDGSKTLRALSFFTAITTFLPIGIVKNYFEHDLDDKRKDTVSAITETINQAADEFHSDKNRKFLINESVKILPETTLLSFIEDYSTEESEDMNVIMSEIGVFMSDWVLAFLHRVYELFRAAGEKEKTGKGHSYTSRIHSSNDALRNRISSQILKDCLCQVFCAMDSKTLDSASHSVLNFLSETLPNAVKGASALCQSLVYANPESLPAILAHLGNNLTNESQKTIAYRIRCMAGAVRFSGASLLEHRRIIISSLELAFSSDDKHIFKSGCKLLRHVLYSQCECYPRASSFYPFSKLGKSCTVENFNIQWHCPNGLQLDLCSELVNKFVLSVLQKKVLETKLVMESNNYDNRKLLNDWRRVLKIIRYTTRGMISLFVENKWNANQVATLHEKALSSLLSNASSESQMILSGIRTALFSLIIQLMSLTVTNSSKQQEENKDNSVQFFFEDIKVIKEVTSIGTLFLSRHGALFRVTDDFHTIQQVADRIALDYTLLGHFDHYSWSLRRAGILNGRVFEEGSHGRIMAPRFFSRLLWNYYTAIQRSHGYRYVDRLRALCTQISEEEIPNSYFSVVKSLQEVLSDMASFLSYSNDPSITSLDLSKGAIDRLCALSCNSKKHISHEAIKALSNISGRYGWLIRKRTGRLIDAIDLVDEGNQKYGIPSCAELIGRVDSQGKRKELVEAVKGVCNILCIKPCIKEICTNGNLRNRFIRVFCRSERLIEFIPTEDTVTFSYIFYEIFRLVRSEWMIVPQTSRSQKSNYRACIFYLLDRLMKENYDILQSDMNTELEPDSNDRDDNSLNSFARTQHWRNRLFTSWFILQMVDSSCVIDDTILDQILKLCTELLKEENGQPLQLVPIGLIGKLVASLIDQKLDCNNCIPNTVIKTFDQHFTDSIFVEMFCRALSYGHRNNDENNPQWAHGVSEVLRDVGSYLAGASFYPFERASRTSDIFVTHHARLIENILSILSRDFIIQSAGVFLDIARRFADAPVSEDKKNQQCTAIEILTGVCRALLNNLPVETWGLNVCIAFLDNILPSFPLSMMNCLYDGIRYIVHLQPSDHFYFLTEWTISKLSEHLWQHQVEKKEASQIGNSDTTSDGFSFQLKLLTLVKSILVEIDIQPQEVWYHNLMNKSNYRVQSNIISLEDNATLHIIYKHLLPNVLNSIGHPYEQCRGSIAGLLFRICQMHRKFVGNLSPEFDLSNEIMSTLEKYAHNKSGISFSWKQQCHCRITIGKFMLAFVRWGDSKFYTEFFLRILPIAFESLKLSEHKTTDSSQLLLDAEVVKIFRYVLAELASINTIAFGREFEIDNVLATMNQVSSSDVWKVRQVSAHFLRCFQGCHKFIFSPTQTEYATNIVATLLSDERREVSSAALAALIGILAVTPTNDVALLVKKFEKLSLCAISQRKRVRSKDEKLGMNELDCLRTQQRSVFFLCAAVLSRPYTTPSFVPIALAAISKHSFERNAPLTVRETVKKCCSEYKRTHIDQWQAHRRQFSQEQLESLDDVVSTPHYYA